MNNNCIYSDEKGISYYAEYNAMVSMIVNNFALWNYQYTILIIIIDTLILRLEMN